MQPSFMLRKDFHENLMTFSDSQDDTHRFSGWRTSMNMHTVAGSDWPAAAAELTAHFIRLHLCIQGLSIWETK